MRSRNLIRLLQLAALAGACSAYRSAQAVLTFGGTGNNYNAAPGNVENYEGQLNSSFTGTIISPNFVAAAAHTFGSVTEGFVFNVGAANQTNVNLNVVAALDDLELWDVAPNQTTTSFAASNIAPIYTGPNEVGDSMVVVGRGLARGAAITGGWDWAGSQGPFSWGDNTISAIDTDTQLGVSGQQGGDYLQFTFSNNPTDLNEAALTTYDSGGGVFIDVNGTYEFDGVNFAADTVAATAGGPYLSASLYNTYGYYDQVANGKWEKITTHTAESSYATRVSDKTNFIGLVDGTIPKADAASAPITVDPSGQLTLYNNLTTGAILGGGALQVGSNFAVVTLQIAPNSGASEVSNLTLFNGNNNNSTLDITNNSIVFDDITPTFETEILNYLKSGYNNGSWNGPGIISTTAAGSNNYGVGFAADSDVSVPGLTAGQAEVAYALYGDCNLNGVVDGVDFSIIAANFNKGVPDGWEDGDFNYDGVVDGIDFGLFALNDNKGAVGVASASDIAAIDAFAAANGLTSYLPEPGSIGLALTAAFALIARPRRKTL